MITAYVRTARQDTLLLFKSLYVYIIKFFLSVTALLATYIAILTCEADACTREMPSAHNIYKCVFL